MQEGEIFSLSDIAFKTGNWQKEYSFGVFNEEGGDDNKMYKMNTIPFSDIRIKKETLELEESQLEIYKRLAEENPKNEKIISFRNTLVRQITDHKRDLELETGFAPVEAKTIVGFLGLIVGWESEEPRFVIETDEGRRLTIRYDKEKTDEVKVRFKTKVKLERVKEGRGWRLLKWK